MCINSVKTEQTKDDLQGQSTEEELGLLLSSNKRIFTKQAHKGRRNKCNKQRCSLEMKTKKGDDVGTRRRRELEMLCMYQPGLMLWGEFNIIITYLKTCSFGCFRIRQRLAC